MFEGVQRLVRTWRETLFQAERPCHRREPRAFPSSQNAIVFAAGPVLLWHRPTGTRGTHPTSIEDRLRSAGISAILDVPVSNRELTTRDSRRPTEWIEMRRGDVRSAVVGVAVGRFHEGRGREAVHDKRRWRRRKTGARSRGEARVRCTSRVFPLLDQRCEKEWGKEPENSGGE